MATLGNNNTSATDSAWAADDAYSIKVTPAGGDFQVVNISIYTSQSTGDNIKAVIWLESDGSVQTVGSETFCQGGPSWKQLNISDTLLEGVTYRIGCVFETANDGGYIYYTASDAGYKTDHDNNYASPVSWVDDGFGNRYHCIYAEGSTTISGLSFTIEGITPASINTLPWSSVGYIR